MKSDVKFEEKLTLDSKNDIRNLINFNVSSGRSENLHFHVLLLSKNITIEPKKYRGVMCHNTEEWCKIWKVTELYFKKWHEKFSEFWPNTWKSENLHFDAHLLSIPYKFTAKKNRRFISHDTEGWSEIWIDLTFCLKYDRKRLMNFEV